MTKRPKLIVPALLVGLLLVAIAVVYFVEPASSLPSFFPGHEAGSGHHHFKHGLLALVLAACCFVFAWFQSGPSEAAARGEKPDSAAR